MDPRTEVSEVTKMEMITRLSRDLAKAAATLSPREARYVVDAYYQLQDYRKAFNNQIKSMDQIAKDQAGQVVGDEEDEEDESPELEEEAQDTVVEGAKEPHELLDWLVSSMAFIEVQIRRMLDKWSDVHPEAQWAKGICGIGPVLGAGLLAYVDITKAPTAGHMIRFAGLDPTVTWLGRTKAEEIAAKAQKDLGRDLKAIAKVMSDAIGIKTDNFLKMATMGKKGKKIKLTLESITNAGARRPWNAGLRTLCWKIGESFTKVSGSENDFYGHYWAKRREMEWTANKAGEYADKARAQLTAKKYKKGTDTIYWLNGCMSPEAVLKYEQTEKKYIGLAKSLAGPEGCGVQMLSPGHIHSRAKRWAVKLFLSHYHHVAYYYHFKEHPARPYVIDILGHADYIKPPNFKA